MGTPAIGGARLSPPPRGARPGCVKHLPPSLFCQQSERMFRRHPACPRAAAGTAALVRMAAQAIVPEACPAFCHCGKVRPSGSGTRPDRAPIPLQGLPDDRFTQQPISTPLPSPLRRRRSGEVFPRGFPPAIYRKGRLALCIYKIVDRLYNMPYSVITLTIYGLR